LAEKKTDWLFFSSWAVSIIATFGSLYFSEVKHYEPCDLCWLQRIFMYPMTILLGVAYVKKDWNMSFYAMILSAVGGSISLYHYCLQKLSFVGDGPLSCGRVPCTAQYINWFGFITIPFLALTAFIMIFMISFTIRKGLKEGNK
jgi:disulfide bond formation protein DsbB